MNPFANAALNTPESRGGGNPSGGVQPVARERPAVFAEMESVVYHDPESGPVYHVPVPEGGYPDAEFFPAECKNCEFNY